MATRWTDEMRRKLHELCTTEDGVFVRDCMPTLNASYPQVQEQLQHLITAGKVFKAKRSTNAVKYFTSKKKAIAWAGVVDLIPKNGKSHKSHPKPDRAAVATMHPNVRVTVAPLHRYDARYQIAPKAAHYGAGFAAVGIGRDLQTGGAWSGE